MRPSYIEIFIGENGRIWFTETLEKYRKIISLDFESMRTSLAAKHPEAVLKNIARRTWVYVQPPKTFDVAPCSCGNINTVWSEYVGHLWCAQCSKDFIPAHAGIFDGPIPVNACKLMGICFDRYNLLTGEIEPFE